MWYVATALNLADLFTKILGKTKFHTFAKAIVFRSSPKLKNSDNAVTTTVTPGHTNAKPTRHNNGNNRKSHGETADRDDPHGTVGQTQGKNGNHCQVLPTESPSQDHNTNRNGHQRQEPARSGGNRLEQPCHEGSGKRGDTANTDGHCDGNHPKPHSAYTRRSDNERPCDPGKPEHNHAATKGTATPGESTGRQLTDNHSTGSMDRRTPSPNHETSGKDHRKGSVKKSTYKERNPEDDRSQTRRKKSNTNDNRHKSIQ